jgi:dATP pyrophosphohydrolase
MLPAREGGGGEFQSTVTCAIQHYPHPNLPPARGKGPDGLQDEDGGFSQNSLKAEPSDIPKFVVNAEHRAMHYPKQMSAPHKIPESVLVVIYTSGLEVLLIERADHPGYWQSVTGSKDTPDEPLTDTAIREVAEETGILIETKADGLPQRNNSIPYVNLNDWHLSNIYEIYPVWRHRYAPGVTQNTEHVFGLLVPRDIPITLAPREHLHHVWLPYQDAADKCFSSSNAEAILQLPNYVRR